MKHLLAILLLLGCLSQAEARTVYYSNGSKALEGEWTYTGITRADHFYQDWQQSVVGWLTQANQTPSLINEFGQLALPVPLHLQLDGPCIFWRTDGRKWIEATYDHGILDGPLSIFHRDGSPQLKATYAGGFPVGRYEWFNDNASKRVSGSFSAYPADEAATVLLDNGNRPRKRRSYSFAQVEAAYSVLQWESTVIRINVPGRREGTFEFSHTDGRAIGRMSYTRGVLDGESIQYLYGPLVRRAVFRMDSLISVSDSSGRDMIAAARAAIAEETDGHKDPDSKPEVQTYPMGLISGVVRSDGKPRPAYRVDVTNGIIYATDGHKMFTGQWKLTGDFQHGHAEAPPVFKEIYAYRPAWLTHQLPVRIRADGNCALWYPNGNKRADLQYDHGILNGHVVFYYDQGNKEMEAVYKAGFPVGPVVAYHRNGRVAFKGTYKPYPAADLENIVLYGYQERLRLMYDKSASALNKEAQNILLQTGGTIYRAPAGNKQGPFYYYDTLGKPALLVHYANDQQDGEMVRFERPEAGVSLRKFVYKMDSLVAAYDSAGHARSVVVGRQDGALREIDAMQELPPAPHAIFTYVEQAPEFNGNIHAYIATHMAPPLAAYDTTVKGKIVVKFVVSDDGTISDVRIVKGLCPTCDAAAIRMVQNMPPWRPGRQNGKAVNVYYNLPINL